jgi:enoyl-[acyl-carrier protein] reductase II
VKIVLLGRESKTWTPYLKENGITSTCGQQYLFALKAQNAGVDAIVAEGFEAGGHNGRMKRQLS